MAIKIEMGIGWKPDPDKPGGLVSADIRDYVAEIESLQAALQPFADAATWFEHTQNYNYLDTDAICWKEKFGIGECRIEVGHLRAAKRALLGRPEPTDGDAT